MKQSNKIQCIFCILCILFLSTLLYHLQTRRIEHFLDSTKSVEFVVAVYEETLDWLDTLPKDSYTSLVVYNKGSPKPSLQEKYKVLSVENLGREGHTYIYHIVNNYSSLADITVFLPGSTMQDPYKNSQFERISEVLKTKKESCIIASTNFQDHESYGFMIDAWKSTNSENKEKNKESQLHMSPFRPMGEWFRNRMEGESIRCVSFRGVVAVSREDIHKRPISFYQTLLDDLSVSSNPEVGHYTERLWTNIFSIPTEQCFQ